MAGARDADAGAQAGTKALTGRGRKDGTGTEDDPIDVKGDLDRALDLLADGKHVRLNQPDEVSTLIGKLGKVIGDARAAGRTPPNVDLCNVTVAGTNLFCVGNKGHRRIDMPQLEGTALAGTPADALPRNAKGFVEVSDQFRQALTDAGVTVTTRTRPANRLRATQAELNGAIVARMVGQIENDGRTDAPIFVTRDGYIIDGHHVWAANVTADARDGKLGDVQVPVHELDMDIGAAIDFARGFAARIGLKSVAATGPDPGAAAQVSVWTGPDSAGFTRPEHAALTAWQGDGYKAINASLRSGKPPPARVAKHIEALDAVLARATTGDQDTEGFTVVYRGMDLTPADYERFTAMTPGEDFTDPGFVATSTDVTTAETMLRRPTNSILMHVQVPAGSHGLTLQSDTDSQYGAESETLLPRGSTFRVVGLDQSPQGFPRLTVELVPA